MNLREALRQAVTGLRQADVPSPTLAAELLLMHVAGGDRAWLYAHLDDPLDATAADRYQELVQRRTAGVPTQYLTGRQEFWGLEMEVTPDVLIPRPETEHLVEVALDRLGENRRRAPLRVADVGTGSGCLAVALARELPAAQVFAGDVSPRALAVARRNAARHGVAARVHFVESNLLAAFAPHSFDIIVSNPPYVARRDSASLPREVRDHEPPQALFGGEHGADVYAPLVAQAATRLLPGGLLVVELGYGLGDRVLALLDAAGWCQPRVTNDLAGIPRVLSAARGRDALSAAER